MLRGNHESRVMTTSHNFREECLYKYDQDVYRLCNDLFDCLPIVAVLNGKFICMHGGLSPEYKRIEDINREHRFQEPPDTGLIADILWSDPVDNENGHLTDDFTHNKQRGCSYTFGYTAIKKFLKRNKLLSCIRAHEVQFDGFKMHNWSDRKMPEVITIFSAPNYCDSYKNTGAIIIFENSNFTFKKYKWSDHPYVLPNFMNLFEWSLPFIAAKSKLISNFYVL